MNRSPFYFRFSLRLSVCAVPCVYACERDYSLWGKSQTQNFTKNKEEELMITSITTTTSGAFAAAQRRRRRRQQQQQHSFSSSSKKRVYSSSSSSTSRSSIAFASSSNIDDDDEKKKSVFSQGWSGSKSKQASYGYNKAFYLRGVGGDLLPPVLNTRACVYGFVESHLVQFWNAR